MGKVRKAECRLETQRKKLDEEQQALKDLLCTPQGSRCQNVSKAGCHTMQVGSACFGSACFGQMFSSHKLQDAVLSFYRSGVRRRPGRESANSQDMLQIQQMSQATGSGSAARSGLSSSPDALSTYQQLLIVSLDSSRIPSRRLRKRNKVRSMQQPSGRWRSVGGMDGVGEVPVVNLAGSQVIKLLPDGNATSNVVIFKLDLHDNQGAKSWVSCFL